MPYREHLQNTIEPELFLRGVVHLHVDTSYTVFEKEYCF